ncbi:hypothetical protein [Magnetospirillum sp. SS-4]|uniref:flagellin N-terminal helical domain-containing protein n=1 Tax=Magnetospirillum sp. SS-4 TaxID=2681465 RepID=UPI0013845360|nr:hypothetical protein [Magnetospirillum sp. SS-4]CAA7618046.1 hypothetical protein MTBSS4_200092 [Magnetospirillum sp. SS-4]
MATDVTLSAAIRGNLLSLQNTGNLVDRTNTRLATGLKVSSAIDDAVAFFQNKALKDRAGDLSSRKDSIDQGISSLQTALSGLQAVESILVQMKGIVIVKRLSPERISPWLPTSHSPPPSAAICSPCKTPAISSIGPTPVWPPA